MIEVPAHPGIYVARLASIDLVPVTQDPRYVDSCARVNCNNVKFGKASNLEIRQRDYWNDFGQDNVEYVPIAITQDYQAAETAVLRRLRAHRMTSPKGGLMDWLEGIEFETVVKEAMVALRLESIDHTPIIKNINWHQRLKDK